MIEEFERYNPVKEKRKFFNATFPFKHHICCHVKKFLQSEAELHAE